MCGLRFLNRFLEGIQIDRNEIDAFNAQILKLFHVIRIGTHAKKSAMHRRVQSLYAAVHDLGKMRDFRDGHNGHTGSFQSLSGAARRNDVIAKFMKRFGEVNNAALVGNTD